MESIGLSARVPELAHGSFLVTGTGGQLRETLQGPEANLGLMAVEEGGHRGYLYRESQAPKASAFYFLRRQLSELAAQWIDDLYKRIL